MNTIIVTISGHEVDILFDFPDRLTSKQIWENGRYSEEAEKRIAFNILAVARNDHKVGLLVWITPDGKIRFQREYLDNLKGGLWNHRNKKRWVVLRNHMPWEEFKIVWGKIIDHLKNEVN